jgi:hypothetical protein|tara:strand:- start:11463 stop:11807 length:345 start_codon:yes stop_codon:yes gene_type:complete
MPKLKVKFREPLFIQWVDSDYSSDWEFYDKKTLLADSRDCQTAGLYLTHDDTVIAVCQSSDYSKESQCVVHAQTTIPWVSVKSVWKMQTNEQIYGKKCKKCKKVNKSVTKLKKK